MEDGVRTGEEESKIDGDAFVPVYEDERSLWKGLDRSCGRDRGMLEVVVIAVDEKLSSHSETLRVTAVCGSECVRRRAVQCDTNFVPRRRGLGVTVRVGP